MNRFRRCAAKAGAALVLGSAMAWAATPVCAEIPGAAADLDLPAAIQQGGLVRGRAPSGSRLSLLASDPGGLPASVRVAESGAFVFGVGRDEPGPIRLELTRADGSQQLLQLPVIARAWRIEDVRGVPEGTVNPAPAIAARIEREQASVSLARQRDDARIDFAAAFDWPLRGRVSGVFGSQRIYNGTPKSPHSGLDVAAPKGTPILAPAGGIISYAQPDLYLTGGTVLIDHGHGLSSSFLHLSRIDVRVGDAVAQGQRIGLVGATGRATGPHMHWGMNWFQVRVDPQLLLIALENPQASAAAAAPWR